MNHENHKSKARTVFRWLAAIFFVVAGINHFIIPRFYEPMIPPDFPSPRLLVVISGYAEIAGGLGLLIPWCRRAAGWGLIALFVAIFPANLYMALHPEHFKIAPALLWARLPFQFLFFGWVWWVALYRPHPQTPSSRPA